MATPSCVGRSNTSLRYPKEEAPLHLKTKNSLAESEISFFIKIKYLPPSTCNRFDGKRLDRKLSSYLKGK
ncbi:hypothetical protein RRG08_014453 [Elysia crispata]|uniref:Uncharacterized protein n=1 Tax=Elysia crispata TaxID=231223 RepID=A0AAE1CZ99_9GAST|nr:hypothetical protein RRG08_014453 [Elysia crispata]